MYDLSKEDIELIVESLDTQVRVLSAKVSTSPNAMKELRDSIDKINKLNSFLVKLDILIDQNNKEIIP